MNSGNIAVVTLHRVITERSALTYYWRLAVYEFKGEPPTAHFLKDLDVGFYNYSLGEEEGKRIAEELKTSFVPGISMGDKLEKVMNHVMK